MANTETSGHLLLPVIFRIFTQVHRFFCSSFCQSFSGLLFHLDWKIHHPWLIYEVCIVSHCYGSRSLWSGASYFMLNVKFPKGTSALINGITFILSVDPIMFCFVCVATGPRSDAEGLGCWAHELSSEFWLTEVGDWKQSVLPVLYSCRFQASFLRLKAVTRAQR